MKQFGRILQFEFTAYLKNKIFVGLTVFLVLLIAIVMCFPRILEAIPNDPPAVEDKPVLLIGASDDELLAGVRDSFSAAFEDYTVVMSAETSEELSDAVLSGKAAAAFFLTDLTHYTYYVQNRSLYDTNDAIASSVLTELYRMSAMVGGGLPPEDAAQIMTVVPEGQTVLLGQDQSENFFYTYIMLFALYMVILLYGQLVSTNVASEKSSRAMELLVTSAKPTAMMFGKVIASCLAGLAQLLAVFGSAMIFYQLNRDYFTDNPIVQSIFNIPPDLLVFLLVFFVLGFFLYAFLFGAIGSTATKLEDINTSTMPLMFMFIIAFMVVMMSMSSGDIDNTLMRICSYFPFTSPMAMFTRIAMSTVPAYEIAISIAILVASVIGVGVISAKIYRMGVLLYGTPPKLSAILKALRKA